MSGGRVMFSAAEAAFDAAAWELRDAFGRALDIERLGPDVGVIAAAPPAVDQVAAACRTVPLVFIRHLTVERARIPRAEAASLENVSSAVHSVVREGWTGDDLAVQAWVSGEATVGYGAGELSSRLAADLGEHGYSVSRAGKQTILSCCITPGGVSVGLNGVDESLSDWPGGRVRLARDAAQVSRAEFKLEELIQTFALRLPLTGEAVDLGASPGGWTRLLRRYGMAVWAVDPGELDPRVARDRGVHHARTTAGEFFRGNRTRFDLAVNDMRMDPVLTCRTMLDAAEHLRRGALAIVTLKVGRQRPVELVRRCLGILRQRYEVVHARQLHHNRQEVTVVARLRET